MLFSIKSNKATLPNAITFSPAKLALWLQSLCLLLHNNFLVFIISDDCWKSSHNLWTLPNHNSQAGSLEGLGFRACYSASAQSPTAPFWKPNFLCRDRFRERRALGHLSFLGPMLVWPIWSLVLKTWKYAPLPCINTSILSFVVPTLVLRLP